MIFYSIYRTHSEMVLFARYTSDVCYYLFSDTDISIMASNRVGYGCVRNMICIHRSCITVSSMLVSMPGVKQLDLIRSSCQYMDLKLSLHDTRRIETSIVDSIARDGVYHRVPDSVAMPIIKQIVGSIRDRLY